MGGTLRGPPPSRGLAWLGEAWPARRGGSGEAGAGMAGEARHGQFRQGKVGQGMEPTKLQEESMRATLPPVIVREVEFELNGDTPLLCHRWRGTCTEPPSRDLSRNVRFARALYYLGEGMTPGDVAAAEARVATGDFDGIRFGFPAVAFKHASVTVAGRLRRLGSGEMSQCEARCAFHVVPEVDDHIDLVEIHGTPEIRIDRLAINKHRYECVRALFPEWSVTLRIKYNSAAITEATIEELLNLAGYGVGVGEWRPEKDGDNGMFFATRRNP